jgi:hypothetical protein
MRWYRFDRTLRLMARAVNFAGLAAATAVSLAACAGAGSADPSSPLGIIDQATRTVQLNLIISQSRFNGYSNGQLTVRVPEGWRVDVYCSNQGATPHSCAIVSGAGSTSPAFSGAASPQPVAGVPAGSTANFSFIVKRVGSYRVSSLVPGDGDRAMWEHFDVVATGSPSVSLSRPPSNDLPASETQARRNS